jgi:hypothetical protein
VQKDNDVLRGIVDRQNAELQARHIELVRFKRARMGLRMVYVGFGIGLVTLAIVTLKVLPQLGL